MAYQTLWVKKTDMTKNVLQRILLQIEEKLFANLPSLSIIQYELLVFQEKKKSYQILWVTEMTKQLLQIILLKNEEKLLANFPML